MSVPRITLSPSLSPPFSSRTRPGSKNSPPMSRPSTCLPCRSVSRSPESIPFSKSLRAPGPGHAKWSVPLPRISRPLPTSVRFRNATVVFLIAVDVLERTDHCHAPTTYRSIRGGISRPCRRVKPVYHAGKCPTLFLPLRDRFIRLYRLIHRCSIFHPSPYRNKKKVSVPSPFSSWLSAHVTTEMRRNTARLSTMHRRPLPRRMHVRRSPTRTDRRALSAPSSQSNC